MRFVLYCVHRFAKKFAFFLKIVPLAVLWPPSMWCFNVADLWPFMVLAFFFYFYFHSMPHACSCFVFALCFSL